MDLHCLDEAVQGYFTAALAPATHKTYKAAENHYVAFCESFGINPLPVSEGTLCYYVACLGQQGLAHSSIRTYLSGVRQLQIAHGFKDINYDEMPRLWQIIKGVQIDQGRKGRDPRRRLPITPLILRKMKSVWLSEKSDPDNLMLWAASTTAFFGFCRSGEVTTGSDDKFDPHIHLSFKDLVADNPSAPSMISILIKQSKTDQERKGMKIIIGKTDDDLCPVAALLTYLNVRGSHPGPLFVWKSGTPLSKIKFVEEVRLALEAAYLPAKDFAGHSFRIGAATTAASAGLSDSAIQTLGCWKSSAYLLYIRSEPKKLAKVSPAMSHCAI